MSSAGEDTSGDLALDRLVFFSDAVFAIAVTLLVLDIKIPELAGETIAGEWRKLAALWPSVFAFVLSFLVIGRFWIGHHERFRPLRAYDRRLMWPNMLYLMAIAWMPFASALLGRNLGRFVPALVYNLSLVVLSLQGLWLARRIQQVLRAPGALPDALDLVLASLLCVALTFALPAMSQWGMITIPLWARLRKRLAAPAAPQTS
jgi:uncharacterized membrane protein